MDQKGIDIAPGHPYSRAARGAERELMGVREALEIGNAGRARVCARRAVGTFLQGIASRLTSGPGVHAMANLAWVADDEALPAHVREAARRLAHGPREEQRGATVSEDPLADALAVINFFVRSASF